MLDGCRGSFSYSPRNAFFCSSTDVKARHSLPNVDRHRVGSYSYFFGNGLQLGPRHHEAFPPPLFFAEKRRRSARRPSRQEDA